MDSSCEFRQTPYGVWRAVGFLCGAPDNCAAQMSLTERPETWVTL